MRKLYKLTLRREFFITGLLSALSISLVFIGLFTIFLYNSSIEDAHQKISTSNMIISANIDNVFRNVANTVDVLTTDPALIHYQKAVPAEQERIKMLFRNLTASNPYIKYCFAGYEDGTFIINNYSVPDGYTPVDRPWYISAIDEYPNLSIGLPFQDVANNEWLISVSKEIVDESGQRVGVVAIGCAFDPIIELMNSNKYFSSQANFIVSKDNVVILHQNNALVGKHIDSISEGSSALLSQESGFIKYKLKDGVRTAYYKKSDLAHWTIVSAIDTTEIAHSIIIRVVFSLILLLVVSLVLGLVQVEIFEQRFVIPLSELSSRLANLMSGKKVDVARDAFTNDELEAFASNIELMTQSTLQKKAEELSLILESTSDSILVLNIEEEVIHYNSQFIELWDLDPYTHYVHGNDFPFDKMKRMIVEASEHCFNFKQELSHDQAVECTIDFKNGRHFEVVSKPLLENGEITGRLWSYRDITIKKKDQERLTHLATTDDLTGLWNRRYFLERLDMEMEIAKRFDINLSLIQMDIDYFKSVNDTYGHAAGDQCLIYVADALKMLLRESDVIGRIGGEEFCILIQNADEAQVISICEKVRVYFERNSFTFETHQINFTVSMGIAHVCDSTMSLAKLLKAADEACYKSKSAGRNTITVNERK